MSGKCAIVHAGNRDGYEASSAFYRAGYEVHLITDYYQDDSKVLGKLMRRLKGNKVDFRKKTGLMATVHIGIVPMLADYLHQIMPRSQFVTRLKAWALARKVRRLDRSKKFDLILFYFNSGLYEYVSRYGKDNRLLLFQMHPHPVLLRSIYRDYLINFPFLEQLMITEEEELNEDEAIIACLSQEADFAAHIICPSNFVKFSLTRYGIDEAKISRVPYGAPRPRAPNDLVRREVEGCYAPETKIRLAFVGQFVLRKGVYELVNFVAQRPDVHLTIYTRDLQYAARRMQEWGLAADNIEFLTIRKHDELWASAAQKDFLILPSLAEGFGLVITEALSAGIPVIATKATCAADLIEDGHSGYLLASGSVEELHKIVERACKNEHNWPSMKANALQVASAQSWDIFAKDLTDAVSQANSSSV